jgi:SAM-dependent methyltransferase
MAERPSAAAELARYYDLDLGDEEADLDLYLALARAADGPLLELAAGSGRLAVPLAAAGHVVTAVDVDPHMLARARQAWAALPGAEKNAAGALETIEADLTTLDLGRRFGLVILALNSLLLLPGRHAQLTGLRAMARHLAPAGRAVLDVWLPGPDDLALYDGRLSVEWTRPDDERGETVAKLVSARYDAALATARVSTFFDAWSNASAQLRRVAREDELSFLAGPELIRLVESAGLAPAVVAQDYGLTPFGTGSERMVLVCGLL